VKHESEIKALESEVYQLKLKILDTKIIILEKETSLAKVGKEAATHQIKESE